MKKRFREYPIKKCKNFGFTFCTLFFILALYEFLSFSNVNKFFLATTATLFFLTLKFPECFRFLGFYWEKFGYFLGRFFSPIILTLVYFFTIIPINLILRIFGIDILKKNIDRNKKSYWVDQNEKTTDFKNQF